jgi:hypothetical protein
VKAQRARKQPTEGAKARRHLVDGERRRHSGSATAAGGAALHTAQSILFLQQTAGNRAVQRLLLRQDRDAGAVERRAHAAARSSDTVERQTVQPLAAPVATVQRHSSWEHQLLGDAKPDDLAKIGTWQNLIEQTKLRGTRGFRKRANQAAKITLDLGGQVGQVDVTKGNVMHILAQHLQLLSDWQDNPPQQDSRGKADPKYQTILVSVPGGKKDGSPLIITYGEMNTLADYYGSVEVMKEADKDLRWMAIQSVRQETFFRLKEIYGKLKDSLTSTEKRDADVISSLGMTGKNKRFNQKLGYKFQGAMAPDYVSGMWGQVDLLKLGGAGASGTNEYAATLGRNACHFVPESWHAWSSYHQKGRDLAQRAATAAADADALRLLQKAQADPAREEEITKLRGEARSLANEALVTNGFGDHYLQDSYAAGHMINKTQIMQWFVQWLDKMPWKMDFASDESWKRVQAIAYNQPGLADKIQYDKTQVQGSQPNATKNRARNPQAVEDIAGDDWKVRFDALGLTVPASLTTPGSKTRAIVEWWQAQAATADGQEQTGARLAQVWTQKYSLAELIQALTDLRKDDVISRSDVSASKAGKKFISGAYELNPAMRPAVFAELEFTLRKAYIPRDMARFKKGLKKSKKGDDTEYTRMAAAVTYKDFITFLNNGYVQKSTNALHNRFCEIGLDVRSNDNQTVFKVYGDDAMFNSNSAQGVKHSGETAHMSRDAILSIIQGQAPAQTTDDILNRLPSQVQPPGAAQPVGIEAWHDPKAKDQLRNYCETDVFPSMGVIDKAVGATGDLSAFITKDASPPHGGEAF